MFWYLSIFSYSVGTHNRNQIKSLVTMNKLTYFILWAHTVSNLVFYALSTSAVISAIRARPTLSAKINAVPK